MSKTTGISPRIMDGEPVCSGPKCSACRYWGRVHTFDRPYWDCAEIGTPKGFDHNEDMIGRPCVPFLRRLLAEARAEIAAADGGAERRMR